MIKICEKNKGKINKFLDEAEGKSRVRTLSYDDCVSATLEATRHPAMRLLTQKQITGATYEFSDAYSFYNAYNGTPYCTVIKIIKRATGWFIFEARRDYCSSTGWGNLVLSVEQSNEAIIRFKNTYTVDNPR